MRTKVCCDYPMKAKTSTHPQFPCVFFGTAIMQDMSILLTYFRGQRLECVQEKYSLVSVDRPCILEQVEQPSNTSPGSNTLREACKQTSRSFPISLGIWTRQYCTDLASLKHTHGVCGLFEKHAMLPKSFDVRNGRKIGSHRISDWRFEKDKPANIGFQ